MKILALCTVLLVGSARVLAQGAPNIVWQAPTPNGLANNVGAVAWSPVADQLAVGSSDRWFRVRRASDGALLYSVLEPQHSHGVRQIFFSIDGALVGVQNQSAGMTFRVQRASDGVFLGTVIGTVAANGIVGFAPDATLLGNTGGDGTISKWNFADLTCFQVTGSGYQTVTTTFNFSPDGSLQTTARNGRVKILRRSDGALVRVVRGDSKIEFSPDSSLLAIWTHAPDRVVVWRRSNWTVVDVLAAPNSLEGVAGLAFSPDGQRLVVTGYSPYVDSAGLWQQNGYVRFWDLASGTVLVTYDQQTDLAVTSSIAWSPDGARFAYGLYDGTVVVALTP